ncbi:MAG TPA: hypothetical protein VNF92_00430 [Gemmatimonadaceae bacterium]|nr:hypothetical protein [Gemmatimonadaceae bacterium]
MPKTIARLLGLGAYAVCGAIIALYVVVAYISRRTPTGGMDPALTHVTWISLGGVTLAVLATHHVIGKQLLEIARDGDIPKPLGAR